MFDLREIVGGHRNLDRAGHREGLVAADADQIAGLEVERGDADVACFSGDEPAELTLERLERRRGCRQGGLREQRQQPAENSNESHALPLTRRA